MYQEQEQNKPKIGYWQVFEPYSDEDIGKIVMLKRVFECAQGDKDFAKAFAAGKFSGEQIARLKRIGVTFDMQDMALCWLDEEFQSELIMCTEHDDYVPSESLQAKLKEYPLLALWMRFVNRKNRLYRATRREIFRVPKNPPFDAWRWRRVLGARSELGYFGHFIDFPILAFELGDGCSVGCWFCAFSTHKLKRNLDYEREGDFFRGLAEGCVSLFGKYAAAMALLYYGTEPHDNPNYLDYLKDYQKITGFATCTSTAMPLDADWLRSLIRYYRSEGQPWPRLSVLSKDMMNKIHEIYAPDELRDVELLMQMKENERRKVSGGRILSEHQGMKEREPGAYLDDIVPQGSIACVSGFLINTVRRDIKIVSPCYTCERWPYGYRVYDSAEFKDASDFPDVVRALIDRNMPLHPPRGALARFRDDLLYKSTDNGFDLISPNQIHHFTGGGVHATLGNLIAQGDLTYSQLDDRLAESGNPLLAGMAVNHLFDGGFMDELYSEPR